MLPASGLKPPPTSIETGRSVCATANTVARKATTPAHSRAKQILLNTASIGPFSGSLLPVIWDDASPHTQVTGANGNWQVAGRSCSTQAVTSCSERATASRLLRIQFFTRRSEGKAASLVKGVTEHKEAKRDYPDAPQTGQRQSHRCSPAKPPHVQH